MNCHITNEFDENSKIFVGSVGKVTITKVDDGKTIQDDSIYEAYISPDLDSFAFKSILLKGEIYELTRQVNNLEIQITIPIFSAKKEFGEGVKAGDFIFKVPNATIAINDRIEFGLSDATYHSFRVDAKDNTDTELIFKRLPVKELSSPIDETKDYTYVVTSENGVRIHVVEGDKTLDINASEIYLKRTFLGRYYICNANTDKKIMRLSKGNFNVIRDFSDGEVPVK